MLPAGRKNTQASGNRLSCSAGSEAVGRNHVTFLKKLIFVTGRAQKRQAKIRNALCVGT